MAVNTREIIVAVEQFVQEMNDSSQNLNAIAEETSASNEEVDSVIHEMASGAAKQAEDAEISNARVIKFTGQIEELIATIHRVSDGMQEMNTHRGMYYNRSKVSRLLLKSLPLSLRK